MSLCWLVRGVQVASFDVRTCSAVQPTSTSRVRPLLVADAGGSASCNDIIFLLFLVVDTNLTISSGGKIICLMLCRNKFYLRRSSSAGSVFGNKDKAQGQARNCAT